MLKFWQVILFNLKVTFIGFGGGNALFPIMRKEAVERKGWISEAEFDQLVVAANMIPGPSVVEGLSYISIQVLGKWKGALASLIGMYPHIIMAVGLYAVSQEFLPEEYLWVLNVSIMPVIIGVLLTFSWRYMKSSYNFMGLIRMCSLMLITIAFALFVPSPFNVPAIIMFVITISMLIYGFIKSRQDKKRGDI